MRKRQLTCWALRSFLHFSPVVSQSSLVNHGTGLNRLVNAPGEREPETDDGWLPRLGGWDLGTGGSHQSETSFCPFGFPFVPES